MDVDDRDPDWAVFLEGVSMIRYVSPYQEGGKCPEVLGGGDYHLDALLDGEMTRGLGNSVRQRGWQVSPWEERRPF